MKKVALILLGGLVVALVLVVVLVIVGSRGTILTGGVPLGGITFTSGDIPRVPAYPGSTQSTDSKGVSVPDDMRRVVGTKEAMWKRYLTGDSAEQVLAWYDKAITDAGFEAPRLREAGLLLFTTGDRRYMVYVTSVQGQTNIILAAGKE